MPGDARPPASRKTRPVKATFRAGQRRASPTTKTFAGRIKPPTLSTEPTKTHDSSPAPSPPHQLSTEIIPNSSLEEAEAEYATEEKVLKGSVETLRRHIAELESSSEASHSQLQGELDGCRARKREEEHARSDLKAKARTLEESKRQAEVEYTEAERRHASAKSNKHQFRDKIERMKAELSRLDRKEVDLTTKQAKSQKHRQEREAELVPKLQTYRQEMTEQESSIAQLASKVESYESDIEHYRTELSRRRERTIRRNHPQRQFIPAQIIPVIPGSEGMPPQPPPGQWASYRDFQSSSLNGSNPGNQVQAFYSAASPGSPNSQNDSFLEHRRVQMGDTTANDSRASSMHKKSTESLADHYSGFSPFGPPVQPRKNSGEDFRADPPPQNHRGVSLPFFVDGGLTSLDGASSSPPLTTPKEGPASPITPHQNSLIPAHLFDMIDNDDDPVPQTPIEVALPPRHNIWSDDAAQLAFNRASNSSARTSVEELTLNRTRSNESSRDQLSSFSNALGGDPYSRHPLSLNPGAKAFNPELTVETPTTSRRGLFGAGSLRDVWARANNKTDHRSAAATAALFEADDIFGGGSDQRA